MIGKTISHFKILKKLGEGGMGVVYKAEDTKLKRTVALKFLPPHLLTNEEEKTRFLHEAQAASTLNHQNITTIYDIYEEEDEIFIAMECVEGETLKDKVEKGPLKTKEFLNIAIAVADGLNAAHEHDIVHRDIKSENIMISKSVPVKIMDFGLAKRKGVTRVTKEGTTLGTLAYMSPEQAEGLEVDRRSDLFSFGVVMYEMATGQLPFKGEHDAAIMYSIVNEAPLSVTSINPNIPKELERFIHKALEKEVEERYQHADDLLADLKRLKKEIETRKTVVTKTDIPITREPEKKPAWRIPAYIFGAVLIGAIAILIYSSIVKDSDKIIEPEINPKSVAVLPFSSITKTEQDENFSEGITDVIISQLAKIQDLKVISRTSTMRYKSTNKTLSEIGNELSVASILEGSIQRSGNRIRIVSQLIDTKTDEHLWTETYDRDYSDIFAIQSDVAQQIAAALKTTLTPEEKSYIEERPTDNLEAYEYYLQGKTLLPVTSLLYGTTFDRENVEEAISMYEKAIELDPNFTVAYAELSKIYTRRYSVSFFSGIQTDEQLAQGKSALDQAQDLDPGHLEVLVASGYYYWYGLADDVRANEQLNRALQKQPNNSDLLLTIGNVKRNQGRYEEATPLLKRAAELDPFNLTILEAVIETCLWIRDWAEAERYAGRYISIAPDPSIGYLAKTSVALRSTGDIEKARDVMEEALEIVDPGEWRMVRMRSKIEIFARDYQKALEIIEADTVNQYMGNLALTRTDIYRYMGKPERWVAGYAQMRERSEERVSINPDDAAARWYRSRVYAVLGRKEEAIRDGELALELQPLSQTHWAGVNRIVNLAVIYTWLGEQDAAIDQLDLLLSIPSELSVALLRIDPQWDPLRDHPRFQKLIKK